VPKPRTNGSERTVPNHDSALNSCDDSAIVSSTLSITLTDDWRAAMLGLVHPFLASKDAVGK
jgi:hypothetical protein